MKVGIICVKLKSRALESCWNCVYIDKVAIQVQYHTDHDRQDETIISNLILDIRKMRDVLSVGAVEDLETALCAGYFFRDMSNSSDIGQATYRGWTQPFGIREIFACNVKKVSDVL